MFDRGIVCDADQATEKLRVDRPIRDSTQVLEARVYRVMLELRR